MGKKTFVSTPFFSLKLPVLAAYCRRKDLKPANQSLATDVSTGCDAVFSRNSDCFSQFTLHSRKGQNLFRYHKHLLRFWRHTNKIEVY